VQSGASAFVLDKHLLPSSPSRRLRRALAKCSGLLLIALLVAGTAWPDLFKYPAGFAAFALMMMATAIAPVLDSGTKAKGEFLAASLMFVIYGAIVLILSVLGIFDIDPTLPVRSDYMLRQSYFLFLWFPFLFGALGFWNVLGRGIIAVCRRWGLPLLIVLAAADIASSRLLGDPAELDWVGYLSFFEKFGLQFLFSLTYLIYVTQTRHWIICLAVITGYALATKLLHAGIMFNATTGAIFFLFLFTSTIPFVSRRLRAIGVVSIYFALISVLAVGVVLPGWFAGDSNDFWRLMAWRSNFEALWHSGFAGVGFGTPYFSLTAQNMLNSMSNQFNTLSADLVDSVSPQYVRGQHSSIVNMFYRTGIIGGALFLYVNILVVRIGFKSLRHPSPPVARVAYVALVLFVMQMVQMTVHVGVETPIFLSIYMLAIAFVLHVSAIAADVPPRGSPIAR
jgi:hypothetical protein